MKSISASLIVIAGVMCFMVGGGMENRDIGRVVMVTGGIIAATGLLGWFKTLRTPGDGPDKT